MQNSLEMSVARDFLRLARIVLTRPDRELLAKLTRAFGRLPYENFTKVLRAAEYQSLEQRLRTPEIVLEDHVALGAGGTCFSLTNFFRAVLHHAGFVADPVLCDRSYGPETHCALMVPLEGSLYLVDPGYLLEEPLLIPDRGESVQRTATGTVQLRRLGESRQLLLITNQGGKRRIRYRMRDIPSSEERFRARWVDSFDWAMMRHLCISRVTEQGQLYVRDQALRMIRPEGVGTASVRTSFEHEVERHFGIDPRIVAQAREAVQKLKEDYRKRSSCCNPSSSSVF